MAGRRPVSLEAPARIPGIGRGKLERYGKALAGVTAAGPFGQHRMSIAARLHDQGSCPVGALWAIVTLA